MSRLTVPFIALSLLAGCSLIHTYRPAPLSDIPMRPPSPSFAQDSGVAAALRRHMAWLDTLRYVNSIEAQRETGKFDLLSLIGISAGTTAAIVSFTGAPDDSKAKVAGIAGAVSAFAVALIAKYRHGEDAQKYRNCSKRLEGMLITTETPDTWAALDSLRKSQVAELETLDCLAPRDY